MRRSVVWHEIEHGAKSLSGLRKLAKMQSEHPHLKTRLWVAGIEVHSLLKSLKRLAIERKTSASVPKTHQVFQGRTSLYRLLCQIIFAFRAVGRCRRRGVGCPVGRPSVMMVLVRRRGGVLMRIGADIDLAI